MTSDHTNVYLSIEALRDLFARSVAENQNLHGTSKELKSKNTELEREVVRLQQEFKYFLSKKFGRSADVTHPGQGHLFDEAERDAPSAATGRSRRPRYGQRIRPRKTVRKTPASAGVS